MVWAVYGAGAAAAACCLCKTLRRKKKKEFVEPPQSHHPFAEKGPGKGRPIFSGLRVVELSNSVAAPLAGRILAELGAEVVKFEDLSGDYFRSFFMEWEPGREKDPGFSTQFEGPNLGKSSVRINLRKPESISFIYEQLRHADVFVTNLRLESLRAIKSSEGKGLDFESMRTECPHIVYAQNTAWGLSGPRMHKPGYDLGAFWTMTGLSSLVNSEAGAYTSYTYAFGDVCTASQMVVGIAAALRRRAQCGEGHLAEASLMRNGLWCLGPWLSREHEGLAGDEAAKEIPEYRAYDFEDPGWGHYTLSDGREVYVTCTTATERTALADALEVPKDGVPAEAIRARFRTLRWKEASSLLDSAGVPHGVMPHVTDQMAMEGKSVIHTPEFSRKMEASKCVGAVPGVSDVTNWAQVPFGCSCSPDHGPSRRAPMLGAHNKSFLAEPWSERPRKWELPKPAQGAVSAPGPLLQGVRVLELSALDLTAAVAAAQIGDLGAKVTKLEWGDEGCVWRQRGHFWRQLNRGKEVKRVKDLEAAGAAVLEAVGKVDMFITSLPQQQLKELGIDRDTLCRINPRLVYGLASTWGVGVEETRAFGDMAGFFGTSGMGSGAMQAVWSALGSRFPMQFGSLMQGAHLAAGLMCALFHLEVAGEGQLVDVNHLRSGVWANKMLWHLVQRDAKHKVGFAASKSPEQFRNNFPVPAANSYVTSDGMWVQLLGVNTKVHLPLLLKALGIALPTYAKVIFTGLWEVAPNRGAPLLERVLPIFRVLNGEIEKAFRKLTWAEAQAKFDKAGVWYCHINSIENAICDSQANAVSAFTKQDGKLLVNQPMQFCSTLVPDYTPGMFNRAHLASVEIP
eukprot:Hpha_TRINITY_DN16822_c0_g12::TRINITY_DN16822_c0_g12_i1::g.149784::m.149784